MPPKNVPAPKAASRSKAPAAPPRPPVPAPGPAGPSAAVLDVGSRQARGFPIVGIGASAGGLAAFEAFFSGLPADVEPGMAFVLVQHLAPDHKSLLTDLIRRCTRMRVFEVEDGMAVQRNCTYIIPPNRDMAFQNGVLRLSEPTAPRGQRLPIDFFFRSLAQDQGDHAICIVLSGTGSDGSLGVRAVKDAGGMAMVQNPGSTEFDGMPRNALATGLVDFTLPPAEMPGLLLAHVAHGFGKAPVLGGRPGSRSAVVRDRILAILRAQTGHDFSHYKPNAVLRRLERRMAVNQILSLDDFLGFLQKNPAEVDALFGDLLIGVTHFFRDPEAFRALEERVVPSLFADRQPDNPIRVWVPGCSTGEEAYSIAILLQERMEVLGRGFPVQIFATDIDREAIATARAGIYPASIAAEFPPARFARFFTPEPGASHCRIHKGIRDMLIFSEQDLIRDPPFSRLDLISCRNLMIYLGGDLQAKIIPMFHYALNPGGILFLGSSESIGTFDPLFSVLDRKLKLYQRAADPLGTPEPGQARLFPPMTAAVSFRPAPGSPPLASQVSLRQLAEQAILRQVGPPSALVNGKGDILYFHGYTGRYLEPAPGMGGTTNILQMARKGLRQALARTLRQAVGSRETVRRPGVRVTAHGHSAFFDLSVHPVAMPPAARADAPLFLVMFEAAPGTGEGPGRRARPQGGADPGAPETAPDGASDFGELRRDLQAKEDHLQTVNEELQSSNEEMQSGNEELQSANEELETSKEELQSVNEELATVNAELQTKVADLSRANNDMNNLLAGTGIATIFIDQSLRLLRFTPAATRMINLIQSDIGRPIGHIVLNLVDYPSLVEDAQAVLDTLVPRDLEVQAREGSWYRLRIQPYRTLDNVVEGAVVTFLDITEMKAAQAALKHLNHLQRLAMVVHDAQDAIIVQDLGGRIMAWNPAAVKRYGWSEAEALAMDAQDRIPAGLRAEARLKAQQVGQGGIMEPYPTQVLTRDGAVLDVMASALALVDETGRRHAIALTERISQAAPPELSRR